MTDIASIVSIPSALQSATSSINRSLKKLDQNAHVVATSQSVMSKDTIQALLDSRQQLLYTKAAAKIMTAADEVMQSAIDIRA
jgi:hypothetical protein